MLVIQNSRIKASFNSKGAELKSLMMNGIELIWQADPKVWGRSAPVLFPVVGKPANNQLLIGEQLYPMTQHGFARDMDFEVFEKHEDKIVFRLLSNDETLMVYPFHFDIRLSYRLNGNAIECGYEVRNTGREIMFFSIGAHPGFNLPSKKLNDYIIEIECKENTGRFLLSDGLLNGKSESVLKNSSSIQLDSTLFEKDAIVFKNLKSQKIMLKSKLSNFKIEMNCVDFPFFGIWSKKDCEDFICLEPWCGIAGSVGSQVPIEQKEGINKLVPGALFSRSYTMAFWV